MENFPPNFVKCFLKLHNQYRARHKAPPLTLDKNMCKYAQEWAEKLAKRGVFCYRPDTKYGENIYVNFWKSGSYKISPKDPLEAWYDQRKYFKYGEARVNNLKDVRHFTQMLWKETKIMGVGLASGVGAKMYLVCNYHPRGNIDCEFANNVFPSDQEAELLKHEAQGIKVIEKRMDVVESMERLYAVPSEKLRTWTVWLTKVGEIADEWQKWLHAHIDFTVRLADHLQAAEEAIIQEKNREEEMEADAGDEEGETKKLDAVDGSAAEAVVEDESEVREIFTAEKREPESEMHIDPSTENEATESDSQINSSTEEETVEDAAPSKEDAEESKEKPDDTETSETNEPGIWPIGQAWKHTGPPETPEPPFEPLPLPRNEEEMRQFLKEFTHQATIYRSYYKHWDETADQAVKEIGGRLVLATYIKRGETCRKKSKKKLSTKKSKPKMATSESKAAEPVPEQKSDDSEQNVTSNELTPDTPTEDAPAATEDAPAATEDAPADTEDAPDPSSTNADPSSPGAGEESSKVQPSADTKDNADDVDDVDDWVKDNARASEPIPYLFYVKAEPDIEIAIEHDDEEVIAADPDRESVVGNYKRLFYNLHDKPCKGGKPWL